MKKLSAISVLIFLTALPAFAADLPFTKEPVAPPPALFSWTGGYFGGNVGYAFADQDAIHTSANGPAVVAAIRNGSVLSSFSMPASGVMAGGQAGYNFEFASMGAGNGGVVLGVEADLDYADVRYGNEYLSGTVASDYGRQLDYLGTVRGRVGYAFDRILVYGTGGFAYGHASATQTISSGLVSTLLWSGGESGLKTGYALGGGVEYALPMASILNPLNAAAVTLKIEYLHYNLGSESFALAGAAGTSGSFTDRVKTDGNIVRGGLNYLFDFGSPATPVVAKY